MISCTLLTVGGGFAPTVALVSYEVNSPSASFRIFGDISRAYEAMDEAKRAKRAIEQQI